ncbi:MAG: hypothetical protein ABJ251_17510 [Paracoccaceae bacterium]
MQGAFGHILWALCGALLGGFAAWAVLPQVFWAALIGGALSFGAMRVGYILLTADDANAGGENVRD